MIAELGHFALIMALSVAFIQVFIPFYGTIANDFRLQKVADTSAVLQVLLLTISFFSLMYSFVVSDFSLRLVFANSHSLKPMLYKVSGVWGNHEGSMLLWGYILAIFGASAVFFGKNLPTSLKTKVLVVQGAVGASILSFVIFTSNPFTRMAVVPFDGKGLNPLLQDPGLAFHPPFLYLGYVGLSMSFAFAVAALWEGKVDAAWGRWVRPWTLAAWIFLTIGIGLGSWWAYYELGWGGFWFWDPVENASFMPWLFATALLHSAIVVEKRESLKNWTILLSIFAFGFSLMGTFIVRSGVITSVHAFASDPERGVYILAIMAFFVGLALVMYSIRAPKLVSKAVFSTVSRETFLVINNALLAVSALVVFVGTLWPLFAEIMFDEKVSVGEPFFNLVFSPFIVLLALILPIGAIIPWKRGSLNKYKTTLILVFSLSLLLALFLWVMHENKTILGPIGVFLGIWVIGSSISEVLTPAIKSKDITRIARTHLATWGKVVAHSGLGLMVLSISMLMAYEAEDIRVATIGESYKVGKYDVVLQSVKELSVDNYQTKKATILIFDKDNLVATLHPEKRFYPVAGMPTTEAGIGYRIYEDLYFALGDDQGDGQWVVRTYLKPFANWLWFSVFLLALGGTFSLLDRRLRIGVVSRKRV